MICNLVNTGLVAQDVVRSVHEVKVDLSELRDLCPQNDIGLSYTHDHILLPMSKIQE